MTPACTKRGVAFKQAFFQRDPLSPPFHVNLRLGLRFLQASLLLGLFRGRSRLTTRALPVHFTEAGTLKAPGRKASSEQVAQWKEARKKFNLSVHAVAMIA